MAKKWWKSKTLQVNTAAAVLVVAEANLNLIQPMLPVNFYAAVSFLLPLVNAGLRVVTTHALVFKK